MLGSRPPQTLAQQTEKWDTYYKPLEYSIDYPDFKDKTANIIETKIQGYPITNIDTTRVLISIMKSPLQSYMTPQEIVVNDTQIVTKVSSETIVSQDIFTSLYDGQIGYTYVTNDPSINRPHLIQSSIQGRMHMR